MISKRILALSMLLLLSLLLGQSPQPVVAETPPPPPERAYPPSLQDMAAPPAPSASSGTLSSDAYPAIPPETQPEIQQDDWKPSKDVFSALAFQQYNFEKENWDVFWHYANDFGYFDVWGAAILHPADDIMPEYGPRDNNAVVFVSNRDGNYEIYTASYTGYMVSRLTNSPAVDGYPT